MFDTYSASQIAFVLIVYLGAATSKGVTGLGFSTTCLPFLALTVGLKEALPLLIIPSVASNLIVQVGAGRLLPTLRRFWPMLLATVPGLILGLYLLGSVDGRTAGGVLGAVLVAWCAFSYVKPEFRLPRRQEAPLAPVSGFLTGLFNGITGSQVMPSMPFLMALHLERRMFIQAINCSFTLSSVIMMIGLSRLGLVPLSAIWIGIAGIAVVFVGVRLGERIRDRLDAEQFRRAVLTMLALLGMSLVVRGVF